MRERERENLTHFWINVTQGDLNKSSLIPISSTTSPNFVTTGSFYRDSAYISNTMCNTFIQGSLILSKINLCWLYLQNWLNKLTVVNLSNTQPFQDENFQAKKRLKTCFVWKVNLHSQSTLKLFPKLVLTKRLSLTH